jgi:hypothetical protein
MPYSEAELIDAIQQASAATDEPLTVDRYEMWRDAQEGWYPHSSTIARQLDSFAAAVNTHTDEQRPTAPTYEREDICTAIRAARADPETTDPLSQREYEQAVPDGPSLTTIRIYFDSWRAATIAAGVDPEDAPPER